MINAGRRRVFCRKNVMMSSMGDNDCSRGTDSLIL
jgi:hypothetical protein